MRKITFLLSFMMVWGLSAQTNLLKNPSFETWADGKPVDWSFNNATGVTVSEVTSPVKGGEKAFKFTVAADAKSNPGLYQAIAIEQGKTYEVTINYYIESGDGTDARIWCNFKKGGKFFTSDELLATGYKDALQGPDNKYFPDEKGAWKSYTTTFTTPGGAEEFNFEVRAYKGSVVYYDEMSLVEKATTEKILNVDQTALSFSTTVGTPTAAQTIQVSGVNLTEVPTYSVDNNEFTVTGTLTVDGGTLEVVFNPTTTGSKSGVLTITGDGITKTVTLTGTAADSSNPYGLDDSSPLKSLNETFGDGTTAALPEGWKNIAAQGTKVWAAKTYGGNSYMEMSAYNADGVHQVLLITPAIDFDAIDKKAVKFDWKSNYTNGATLNVYVMSKDGKKDEVKVINDNHADGWPADYTTETLDLSAFSGIKFLVFEYNGEGKNVKTTTYQVDNVVVKEDEGTGIVSTKYEALKLWSATGKVMFTATAGESVEIYNTVGQRMYSALATDGQNEISLNQRGIVIVKVGNRIGKLIL
ncbi:MAG TPA: hypothetical protein GXZ87_00845 [Bacteroidales bacterium]|nr:hypothetical protein [Bacteroidales bacterium]